MNPIEIINKLALDDIDLYLDDEAKLKAKAPKGAITAQIAGLIKANKDALVSYLQQLSAIAVESSDSDSISRVERSGEHLPVSFAQQRLWFIDSLQGGTPEYNMPMVLEVKGPLNTDLISQVFATIVERHEILRTVYVEQDGKTMQHIRRMSDIDFAIDYQDLSDLNGQDLEHQVTKRVEADINNSFNLAHDVMLRVSYLKKSAESGVLLFNMHHIASDGWSMEVLTKEFYALYHAYSKGQLNPLPTLEIQYADYAHWQRTHLEGEKLDAQLDYWVKQLDEIPAVHTLPLDFERPAMKKHAGAIVTGKLPDITAQSLLDLAKAHKLTPFMLLHGALSLLLSRHSNSHDIVIGTPVANRMQREVEPLIGFFVNTLVLRADTCQPSLPEYFSHIRQVHLDAQSNQDVPFEQLVERLKAPRSAAHGALFQIMLTTNTDYGLDNEGQGEGISLPGVDLKAYETEHVQAKFDLEVDLSISERGVGLHWTYDTSLFTEQHITQLNDHLCRLLDGLAHSQMLESLPLLSENEVQDLVISLNETEMDYPKALCIHQMFEQKAQEYPDKVAVIFDDKALCYKELNEKANQMAHYLKEHHQITPDSLIGLCVERSLEMVIAMLAVLKAGAAYVPLDPAYPQERLNYMLNDAALSLVLSQTQLERVLSDFNGAVVMMDSLLDTEDQTLFSNFINENLSTEQTGVNSANLAYVIYTSGSTGKPKGVLVEHQSVVNLVCSQKHTYGIEDGANEVGLMLASFAFDAAVEQVFAMLLSGNTLVVPSRNELLNPEALLEVITKWNVTHVDSTPSHLLSIVECLGHNTIARVVSGGEAMLPQLRDAISNNVDLYNVYGPTETCVTSSVSLSTESIGRPIANTEFYLLDSSLSLVPKGSVGELFIGGDGLARGYLNRPELTSERFIANPFYSHNEVNRSRRLYRTGDLVKYLPDGNLAFVGRADDQVKIRGFRIELGEIEAKLSALSSVDSALVLAKDVAGSKQLVAYVISDDNAQPDHQVFVKTLQNTLKGQLPEYMVPSFIVLLEQWPLTPSGKIARKELPEPDSVLVSNEYIAPATATEQVLVDIWAQLLNMSSESISTTANFFELGGHSLLCIRLISEIRNRCEVEMPVHCVFDNAILRDLANVVEHSAHTAVRPPLSVGKRNSDLSEVSFAQQRLWFIDNFQGGSPQYNVPMVFKIKGALNLAHTKAAFSTIIERHEVLRSVYLERNGNALQSVRAMDDINFDISVSDLSDLTSESFEIKVKSLVEKELTTSFDLSADTMLRVCYFVKGQDEGVMTINMHHIASDGWSMELLTKEFFALYQAYSHDQSNPLPELKIQYADYAHWQRDYLKGEVLESQLGYWEKQLADLPAVHNLPLDFVRPDKKQHQGAMVCGQLPASTAQSLLSIAKDHNLTPFMLLHGALAYLLSKHSNSHDIVIGTPVANRLQPELEPMIGFFVNTLVLRVDTCTKRLSDYFAHVRQVHLDAQSNQDVPFEQLVERVKAPRSTAYSPLFQIMLTTDTDFGVNDEHQDAGLPGIEISGYHSDVVQAKFDLNVDLSISEQGVGLQWIYDTALFTHEHIEQLNAHMCRLLGSLAQMLDTLSLLSTDEMDHLLYGLNDTALDYDKDACIHELFERQALKKPDNIAVVFEDQSLTYKALNERANQLAHYLKENHQICPDKLVGVCVERSIEMVVGILAILKSGGAYVPLDPAYPEDRLNYMLADASVDVVLSQSRVQSVLTDYNGTVLTLDGIALGNGHSCHTYNTGNLSVEQTGVNNANLAYVIYTSGSTGKPKGVMIEHRNTVAMLSWGLNAFSQDELEVVLASTSLNFDLSIYELFLPLSAGTRLRVVSNVLDLVSCEYVKDITLINTVPSAMDALLKMDVMPDKVKVINLAGEALRSGLVNGILTAHPQVSVCNLYGPSEDTTYSTYARFDKTITQEPHIGKVISNSIGLILNDDQQLVPFGVAGELYLGGDGLSRGYLNRDELTVQRYIENPYYNPNNPKSVARLYRTGDLVRYLPDGNMAYIGRIDHQVKIRGFRIELGEVESQLGQLAKVDSALVMAKQLSGTQELVGYVKPVEKTCESAQAEFIAQVKNELSQTLPEYMVPGIIVLIDQWPLTPNGKMDRKALPQPQALSLQGKYVAPVSETEQALTEIWAQVLNLQADSISADANFFELGGHSLLTVQLMSQIQKRFDKACELSMLFTQNSIQSQANMLDQLPSGLNNTPLLHRVRENPAAQQAIVFIPGVASTAKDFDDIIQCLQKSDDAAEIAVFRHKGLIQGEQYFESIEQNVAAFADALKALPARALTLVGHSYGGALALGLANLLKAKGYDIQLVMLDTYFGQQGFKSKDEQAQRQEADAAGIPVYLQDLFKHQFGLFTAFEPQMNIPLATSFVFATQASFDQSQYQAYLDKRLPAAEVNYSSVEGDHFSMLQGQSAALISAIIKNKGNSQ